MFEYHRRTASVVWTLMPTFALFTHCRAWACRWMRRLPVLIGPLAMATSCSGRSPSDCNMSPSTQCIVVILFCGVLQPPVTVTSLVWSSHRPVLWCMMTAPPKSSVVWLMFASAVARWCISWSQPPAHQCHCYQTVSLPLLKTIAKLR